MQAVHGRPQTRDRPAHHALPDTGDLHAGCALSLVRRAAARP